jgi:molecular chaperone HtpG
MLKGVLDCPDMPLNVSRSYLQNNGYVSKITAHIVKKVTDKLCSLMNTEREKYETLWKDIKLFVEYACMRDRKFYDRVKGSILFETTDGERVTVDEYLEKAKEKHENTVYYTSDATSQAQYLNMFSSADIQVIVLDKIIDTQFITVIEQDKGITFSRIDASIASALKGEGEALQSPELVELFKKISGNEKLKVEFESLKDASVPALLNVSEQSRRFEEMMKMYSMGGDSKMPSMEEATLILNSESPLIKKLAENPDEKIARQLYILTVLSQRRLSAEELRSFLSDSYEMLEGLI